MKNLIRAAAAGVLFLLASCSSDDPGNGGNANGFEITNDPMANEAFDSSNFGIYKGVFVGSSGSILINMANDGEVSARLIMDGDIYDFTTVEAVAQNQPIVALTFTSDDLSFDFYADADGNGAYVADVIFPGHDSGTIQIAKEFSDQLVECWEGTYSGEGSGTFNLLISNGIVRGLTKSEDTPDVSYLDGTIEADAVSGFYDFGDFTGTRTGNTMNGSLTNNESGGGNWTATRKL